ncbi:helix-turn-helix domain-containing protein [Agromyces badenianii]|uniref:helix-turn-helix domain-containing protein n=1 Tax=Agromyces badenianii TaxID=2080742 RepID=UPI000D59DB3C|nr:helix-turn-helix domain-containing protein [Agromyces badenianii]PWC05399.1 hypothetical protein DCE94_03755 [Agromyces badenianii]
MARRGPVQPEERARVIALVKAGKSRNDIARETGLGAATVSRIAKAVGLSFDRSKTAAATEARKVDLAAERIRLLERMLANGHAAMETVEGPVVVYNFGGKDNTYREKRFAKAPLALRKDAQTTAGIAFDKATRIVEKDNGGLDQAVGVLDQIAEGFKAAAEKYRAETPEGTDEPE